MVVTMVRPFVDAPLRGGGARLGSTKVCCSCATGYVGGGDATGAGPVVVVVGAAVVVVSFRRSARSRRRMPRRPSGAIRRNGRPDVVVVGAPVDDVDDGSLPLHAAASRLPTTSTI